MEKLYTLLEDIRPDVDFRNITTLITDGFIDSFDIVTIIASIEDEFSVEIPVDSMMPENFESEIRHQITADITAANKDELLGLQQEFESKRQELSDKKEEIEQIEKQLKEEYEPVFGKDLLYKQRLNKFDSFCQENADLSLEEALTQYRALSGSKLLKK